MHLRSKSDEISIRKTTAQTKPLKKAGNVRQFDR